MARAKAYSVKHDKAFLVMLAAEALAFCLHAVFVGIFYFFEVHPLYYFNCFSLVVFSVLFYVTWAKGLVNLAMVVCAIEVIAHQTLAVILLGWNYGFQYYLIAVPGAILLANFKRKTIPLSFTLICFVVLLVLGYLTRYHITPAYHMPLHVQSFLYLFNLGSIFVLIALFEGIFVYTSKKYEDILLRNQEQLYVAATTDTLTQLANREKIMDLMEHEEIRSQRSGKPYALSIGDIDNFKNINDTYGHDFGDAVLVAVAKAMKEVVRGHDVVGRWGGEEFIIFFPETDLEGAGNGLARLQEKISQTRIERNGVALSVTMTIGVADSTQAETIDEILKLADLALYDGKRGSKNCIVFSEGRQEIS